MAELAASVATWRGRALALVVVGVAWLAVGGAFHGIRVWVFGSRPVYIHVRWAASVGAADQREREIRYGLLLPEIKGQRTWGYTLANQSAGNIRAFVGDPAIEDTHYIHRTEFRVGRLAPWRPYVTAYPWIPVGLDLLTLFGLLTGVGALGLAGLDGLGVRPNRGPVAAARRALLEPRATWRRVLAACGKTLAALNVAAMRLVATLGRQIPEVAPEAVAIFRVVFGLALIAIVLRDPPPADFLLTAASAPHAVLLRAFDAVPAVVDWIATWVMVWGALFVLGVMARTSYVMLAVGVFAWVVVSSGYVSYHAVAALEATVLCLLGSRWGDAWSVDAWMRKRPARGAPRDYGYTVWVPGVVLGVCFAAAAVAKMINGPGWILNGTVKYHFLADSPHALVGWGLEVWQYPRIAVLLSFGAIAIEAVAIVGALARRYVYRLAVGLSSLGLLLGFLLFQGLFWPGYWVLLLSFLPWHLVSPGSRSSDVQPRPGAVQGWRPLLQRPVVVVLTLMLVQVVVSAFHVEVPPFISSFDMYATTYTSPADFDNNATRYWLVGTDDAGRSRECPLDDKTKVETMSRAAVGGADWETVAAILLPCMGRPVHMRTLELELRRAKVDWVQWRFTGEVERQRVGEPFAAP